MYLEYLSQRCGHRMLEWFASGILLSLSVWGVVWPQSFSAGRFSAIHNVIDTKYLVVVLMWVSVARFMALFLNGSAPFLSPFVRSVGALAGSAIFLQMGLALWLNHLQTGVDASPGIPVYGGLALAEAYSAIRAGRDARFRG